MRKFFYALTGMAGIGLTFSGQAMADGCTYDPQSGYYNYCPETVTKSQAEVEGVSNRVSATAINSIVGNRVAAAANSGKTRTASLDQTGVAAGDGPVRYALWASLGADSLSNTIPGASFSGTLSAQTVGLDVALSERSLVGVALVHEGSNFSTDYNVGKLDSDGWSVVPYAAYDFGQGTTIDGLVGLTYVNADVDRAASSAKGHYTGYRAMAAINGHHTVSLSNQWSLRGDLGALWARSEADAYEETGVAARQQSGTTAHLFQSKAGARLSYLWGQVEPFASAYYAYDFVADVTGDSNIAPGSSDDKDEFQFYAGLDWFPTDTESVGIEVHRIVGRDRSDSMGLLFNARLRF